MENGPWATVTEPVARAEFFEPFHAAYVKVSTPTNPSIGKYVKMLLLTPTDPFADCEITRRTAPGGLTTTVRFNCWLLSVEPETALTVGGGLLFSESLSGPL
jgi:hypothetical protein